MNTKNLVEIGLNDTQAKVYIYLVKNGSVTPPEIANELTLKRPTAYAVLDQLVEMKLARKKDVKKKYVYFPENPVALEKLARQNRENALAQERTVQAAMPTLLKFFHTYSDQPGISFYQGTDGIKEIYNDILRTCKDVYVFRSAHDQDLMTTDYFMKYKERRAKLGITTHMINPANNPTFWNENTDSLYNLIRTPIPSDSYTAPVEISTYGDKVSIISFGEEAIGTILFSPQIALAIKQIFALSASQQTK